VVAPGLGPRSVGRRHGPFAHVVQFANLRCVLRAFGTCFAFSGVLQSLVALFKSTAAGMFRLKSIARGAFFATPFVLFGAKSIRVQEGLALVLSSQFSVLQPRTGNGPSTVPPLALRSWSARKQTDPHARLLVLT